MEDPVHPAPRLSLPAEQGLVGTDDLTDEEAARRARARYRKGGLPTLAPDNVVAPLLGEGERVHDWRGQASLSRVDERTHAVVRHEGPLYVTSNRLLHVGTEATTALALAEIEELAMADDRILVTISNARGVMLDVERPRQLRVLLAAARGAAGR